ncbi:MAG TPA: CDP-alcohol phosphatidyltransferase [Bacteroidetes bacterium]|nr:CDP-alcohol phosphatidyltransferase [Bacteroidota bacterium]
MLRRIWTISNLLSFSRIVLLVPLAFFLLGDAPNSRIWAAAVVLVAGLTDFFDGFVARRLHQVTDLGKILDPVADKIAAGGSAILLLMIDAIPLWYVVVVISRDLVILLGSIYIRSRKNVIAQSNWPGKIAVTAIAVVVLLSVLGYDETESIRQLAIWLSLFMMSLSLALYAQRLFVGTASGRRSDA